jgi:hypothetical protein
MFVYQNMERPCIPFDFIGDKPQGRIISFISTVILSYHKDYPLSQKKSKRNFIYPNIRTLRRK